MCPFFLQENGERKRHVALLERLSWPLSVSGPARLQGTKAQAWGPGQGLWGQEPLWGLPHPSSGLPGLRPRAQRAGVPTALPGSSPGLRPGEHLDQGWCQEPHAGLSAHLPLGGGGTLDLQCPLLPARVDPRPVPLTQNRPGLGTRTELGRRADPMAGHGAGCGPWPPPSSPDSSKHPFTCGDVPAVLGDGRAAASNEQCRGWDPTPWAAPITAPSPKTCSVTLTLEAPPTLHGPQGLLFPPAAHSPGPGVLGSASDVPPTLEDFPLAHSGPSSRSGRPRGAGIFLRPHLPVPPPRVQKTP